MFQRYSSSVRDCLLRPQEVADTCAISLRQVWVLAARGELPTPIKLGRATRWRQSDITRWLSTRAAAPAPAAAAGCTSDVERVGGGS